MKRRGVTLADVGSALGRSISAVNGWTQAKNWPEVELHVPLSEFLGESPVWLFYGVTGTPNTAEPQPSGQKPDLKYGNETVKDSAEPLTRFDELKRKQAQELTVEIHRLLEEVIGAAKGDPNLISWILEQVRQHLRTPAYWRLIPENPLDHPAVKEAIARAHQNEFRNPDDAGKKGMGTGQPRAAS